MTDFAPGRNSQPTLRLAAVVEILLDLARKHAQTKSAQVAQKNEMPPSGIEQNGGYE